MSGKKYKYNTSLSTPLDNPISELTKTPPKPKNLIEKATNQIFNEQEKIKNLLLEKDKEIERLKKQLNISDQEQNDKQKQLQQLEKQLEQTNQLLEKWEYAFPNQEIHEVQEERTNLEEELEEQKQKYDLLTKELERTLESTDLTQIKDKIKELEQRPDIPITEQQWWDDYSRRKSHEQSERERKEWEQDKQKIKEYEEEIKTSLEINNSNTWKLELAKLKNEKEGLEKNIKLVMNLTNDEPLPNNWQNQLTSQQQIKSLQYQLEQEQRRLKEWTSQFPSKTPQQISQERQNNRKITQDLQEWKSKFENKNANQLEKEIKNKDTEILILKQQIAELGGTAGANPSERLIESKLREVVGAEEWDLGYLTQVLEKFLEWREWGSSEQKRAINKYWIAIKKNLEYLKIRNSNLRSIE